AQYLTKNDTEYSNNPQLYLLIAYCYKNKDRDLKNFVKNAEYALSLEKPMDDKGNIHLELFNAYLDLYRLSKNEQKKQYQDKAAQYLFLAMQN
ncbi:MAG TPA: hypothetical protein P5048_04070, partial [Chlamydiales bacterium]|nr:hypothetical protein [Chlamydiales bacterium]